VPRTEAHSREKTEEFKKLKFIEMFDEILINYCNNVMNVLSRYIPK
jgi:hypothetical protein